MFRLIKYESRNFYKQKFERCFLNTKYIFISFRHKSYYYALGLDSKASAKDIKSAYYKLSLQYHPDKNKGSEECASKFREITEAYEVLGNPERKKKYDQEYSFQPYYSPSYRQTGSFRKSSNYQGPYTGKTKGFDYDEHFRNHYGDVHNRRQAEYEYFKRRWESDFSRRYPNTGEYYRNRHENSQNWVYKSRIKAGLHSIFGFIFVWVVFFMITSYDDVYNPDRRFRKPSPVYYKVSNKYKEPDDTTKNES